MSLKYFTLNFGPQHPAAHGVLRLILFLKGEVVKYADAHIGLLHRGTEKLLEYKLFSQGVPYFARLDYVSTISQEHVYCLAIENLLNLTVDKGVQFLRIIFLELTRILNHLLAITTHALDVGAMTPFLWAFEEREKIMEFYERVSGARLHTSFFRIGGVSNKIDFTLINDIQFFLKNFTNRFNDIYYLLLKNRIWKQRLIGIGAINMRDALNYSFTGPMIRSVGLNWDIRNLIKYEVYDLVNFNIIVGINGDCFDRFLIRIEEMRESISIINQAAVFLNNFTKNEVFDTKNKLLSKNDIKNSMEYTINHFKYYSEGFSVEENSAYFCTENPKGEFGVYIETDNSNKPLRCKIKSTGIMHLQGLNLLVKNHLLADVVTIIGTQDLVFGEIDR